MGTYITVGTSFPKKPLLTSKATRWFEGVDHSHVYITWKDGLGLRWVAEAHGSGIRVISNVEFKMKNRVINLYKYNCSQDGHDAAIKWMWAHSHLSYAFMQLYGLFEMRVLGLMCRFFKMKCKPKNRFANGAYSQICTEFVLRALDVATEGRLDIPEDVENFGLYETSLFNKANGELLPQEMIDRINS